MIIVLILIFAVGALEFGEDDATFAQVARGLATMVLAIAGVMLHMMLPVYTCFPI